MKRRHLHLMPPNYYWPAAPSVGRCRPSLPNLLRRAAGRRGGFSLEGAGFRFCARGASGRNAARPCSLSRSALGVVSKRCESRPTGSPASLPVRAPARSSPASGSPVSSGFPQGRASGQCCLGLYRLWSDPQRLVRAGRRGCARRGGPAGGRGCRSWWCGARGGRAAPGRCGCRSRLPGGGSRRSGGRCGW